MADTPEAAETLVVAGKRGRLAVAGIAPSLNIYVWGREMGGGGGGGGGERDCDACFAHCIRLP